MEKDSSKLSKRVKKMKIRDTKDDSDEDSGARKKIPKTSYSILKTLDSVNFHESSKDSQKQRNTKRPLVLFADVNHDDSKVICGLSNDQLKLVDPLQLTQSVSNVAIPWRHHGLSCLRCSKTNPSLFFTSSSKEGSIFQWDLREESRKAVLKFHTVEKEVGVEATSGRKPKPILSFDVSKDDKILCGGTEIMDEDSYLLFWDARSPKLLGAYWESHSDDVTAVKFSPENSHIVASGSTDGLLNVFDLNEPTEDDALQFSFNTESSVDTVEWGMVAEAEDAVSGSRGTQLALACITHTNELQLYDIASGDPITSYSRKTIADSMKESNAEDVHLSGCFRIDSSNSLGLLASSLAGGNPQLLRTERDEVQLRGVFSNQSSVIQTATRFSSTDKWLTFDDEGYGKLWERESNSGSS